MFSLINILKVFHPLGRQWEALKDIFFFQFRSCSLSIVVFLQLFFTVLLIANNCSYYEE